MTRRRAPVAKLRCTFARRARVSSARCQRSSSVLRILQISFESIGCSESVRHHLGKLNDF